MRAAAAAALRAAHNRTELNKRKILLFPFLRNFRREKLERDDKNDSKEKPPTEEQQQKQQTSDMLGDQSAYDDRRTTPPPPPPPLPAHCVMCVG